MSPSPRNTIVCGDALSTLAQWPADFVDCIITSPPYYQQRNYGDHTGQIGQEASPETYVRRLVEVFAAARRTLKPTGSLWLVLGDKYQAGRLLGLPWRVALALADDGWLLRSDVIWHKPNAMPSSVKNRLTVDHEYVFLLTRSASYAYHADAIREPHVTFGENSRMKGGRNHFFRRGGTPEQGKNGGDVNLHNGRWDQAFHPLGRNKRTVWSIPLSKYRGAHFAVFPPKLVTNCVQASTLPGQLVLDPFCGSGTTLAVARDLGRDWLGVDCVAEYCDLARERLGEPQAAPM